MGALWDGLQETLGTLLAFFYDVIPNYGVAIIFLTILINVVLFPLTLKQTRSTRAFQKIQPEIKKLQAKHKDDPQALQAEMMALQKKEGATPGGCLIPLIVQMPIWFALFRVLREPLSKIPDTSSLWSAIDSDRANFLGMNLSWEPSTAWAEGITTAIPYLFMMALMVGAQYVQQWHAQPKGDGQQDKQAQQMQAVTKIMPLFIGFISWGFPAGLTLYWTTSNMFRVGQQVLIFRMEGRPEPSRKASGDEAGTEPTTPSERPQGSAKKRRRRRRS